MFSIVIPVFNEEDNLASLIREIKTSLIHYEEFELIFVNDFSSDNTLRILDKEKTKFNFKILNNNTNLGQSYSTLLGVKNSKYNTIVTLDGDGQNNPNDIPKMINEYKNRNVKLIGGLRLNRKDTHIKKISSKIANLIRSKILNDRCLDTGCSLKVFDKDIFLEFPRFKGLHRFLPALFSGFGYNTFFIEVGHRYRAFGKSKYQTLPRLMNGIIDLIRVYTIIKKEKKNAKLLK